MSKQRETAFESWEFSDRELALAASFTELQLQYIRTLMAGYAADRIHMKIENKDEFLFAQCYAHGAIDALTTLLNESDRQITILARLAAERQAAEERVAAAAALSETQLTAPKSENPNA